ncbi:efflux RND transporter permease subunit [Panacagrimonas sp.]|uniref:efflux RND transporter permease subunit n=1 Tax=Panacagrimonas sp. TaxID=2480088 RepID=UPI003B52B6C7
MSPQPLRDHIARWVMSHRALVAVLFLLISVIFLAGIPRAEIRTVFKDLLPKDDPFVQVYYDHPNFGNPLTVYIVIKRRHGTIYNPETLQKVWTLTRAVDLTPGLDHDQLLSISTEKLRYVEATPRGMDVLPLMVDRVPVTQAEIKEFRDRVERSPNARIFFVSRDETATLIQASFHNHVDFGVQFDVIRDLVRKESDVAHEIFVAGQPTLIGWVYHLQKQTYAIFGITFCLLTALLILYMRNVAGVVMPLVCAIVAAIWGVGFIGWLQRPIEPLLTIVPLLLVARTFSHCIQYTERYYEILVHVGDRRRASEATLSVMLAPSVLGILTDVFGIVFIAITPIVTLHNHALFCGAWALWIIPTGVFLAALLLSVLPVPKNFERISGGESRESGIHLLQKRLLRKVARLTFGRSAKWTALTITVVGAWAAYETFHIKIGNPTEGSNLLWYDSDFNRAVRAINSLFPGMNTLELVIESKNPDDNSNRTAWSPEAYAVRLQLQALMESDPVLPPRATLSYSDYMSEPPRESRRLPHLREWSHDQSIEVFPGSAGARGPDGGGARGAAHLAVGGDRIDCRQDWLYGRDAAALGAPGRA